MLQCAVAAAVAWFVAADLIGHQRPFFAPIAAVVSLGTSYGQRLRRVAEVTIGVAIGVFVADVLVAGIGSGAWQARADRLPRDVDGAAARRRHPLRHPGRGAVHRRRLAAARCQRRLPALDRRPHRRRRGPRRRHGRAGRAAAASAGAGRRRRSQDRRACSGRPPT
ncbi:FUSC family protein [Nocardioides convexus]|uniref:FUSC family protein n=1 Tax=Nocardioides convexus TaxID=2712224 RepID=UPI002418B28A|nr:FUSC family protein [Nocardioides convexus]